MPGRRSAAQRAALRGRPQRLLGLLAASQQDGGTLAQARGASNRLAAFAPSRGAGALQGHERPHHDQGSARE
eukprot:3463319-Pyramimonas_sp.AAC.1